MKGRKWCINGSTFNQKVPFDGIGKLVDCSTKCTEKQGDYVAK
jgi:hypothetical protein